MLQILQGERSHAILENEMAGDREDQGGLGDLVNYALAFLRRQYVLILFVTMLAIGISLIYLRVTPPIYTAQVKVLFESPKAKFVQQQSMLAESPLDVAQLESQIQVIKSKAITTSVVDQFNLVKDPDFNASVQPLQKLLGIFKGLFGASAAKDDGKTASEARDGVIAAFQDKLVTSRVGMSNVIEISYSSSNPQRAAEIANAVADTYIADQLNAKFEANRTARSWLQDRLRELGQQALTAERAVNAFKIQNNIVAAGGQLMDEQQVTDLNGRLVAARAQASDTLARLNRFQAILHQNESNKTDANLDASISDALSSPIINNLRQQYLELSRRESDWSARFGRNHLAVVNLRTRMHDLRTSILEEVRRLSETAKSDYEVAKQRQQEIEKQLTQAVSQSRTTNSAEATMRELETRAKSYRSLYESFLQRYMGAVQQESFPITEARVISPASPPQSKSKPKSTLVLGLGFLGGLALGTGLALLRDMLDRVFRTGAQVEAMLHMPCISLVPLLKDIEPKQLRSEQEHTDRASSQGMIERHSGVYWAATEMPLSRFAESIRSIKLAIDLNVTNSSNKVIGITSSLPNEGKSTIAAALAQLMAHAGTRVIVVDCDLRNPSLSRNLAPAANAGIVDVISGRCTLDQAICKDPKTNLAFLPATKKQPLFHTSEILSATSTKQLFDHLRATYDYIIVDLPPLAPVVDVRATAPLMDCLVLAIEWGRTKTDVVQHALHTAPGLHPALIGAVLNKTDMQAIRRYDNYHSDYYSNEHFARYGYTA
ncbi:MAG: polysaccharide biosynthesis tyrosine autokinase [Rhizobiales bacterium]|nr:polysaccharide biosynthesis tyrosine autokinase [Hyphomicrobiales bacterium]